MTLKRHFRQFMIAERGEGRLFTAAWKLSGKMPSQTCSIALNLLPRGFPYLALQQS